MKQKFKKLSKVFSALATILILTQCQKEDIDLEHQLNSSAFKTEIGTFSKFKLGATTKNLKIFNSIKPEKSNLTTQSQEDGFYFIIDTTKIVKITSGLTQTYTIKVRNSLTPTNSFQNLVINQLPNNTTKAYLYTYFPDQTFKTNVVSNPDVDFTGYAKVSHLDINNIKYQVESCTTITIRLCDHEYTHLAGPRCANTYAVSATSCSNDNALDSPASDIGGTYAGIGNTNNDNNNLGGAYSPFLGAFTRPLVPDLDISQLLGQEAAMQYNFIQQNINLSLAQTNWIIENAQNVNTVFNYLVNNNTVEGKAFVKELIDSLLEMNYATAQEILEVAKITMYAKTNNYFNQNLDNIFFTNIDNDSSVNFIDPYTIIQATQLFLKHCAILKSENPTWTQTHIFAQAWLDTTQLMLDIVGLAPGFGEIADIANGIIYTITGQSTNALLSFAAAIPIGGWYASGIKFAKRADGLRYAVVGVNNAIHFGAANSTKFRAACGLIAGNLTKQAHHIIPRGSALLNHPVVQRAAREASNQGFHIDSALNGIAVATWRNQPNHSNYNNRIYAKLEDYIRDNPNASPLQCYNKLMEIIQLAKNAIINNPNTHLNDLIF